MGHDTSERDNMWRIALALEKEYERQNSTSRRLPLPLPPLNGLLSNMTQLHTQPTPSTNGQIRLPPINFANLTSSSRINSPMASISPRTVSPRESAILPSMEHDSPSFGPGIPHPPNPTADSISSTHSTAISLISASKTTLPIRSGISSASSTSTNMTITPETHSHLQRQLVYLTGLENACIAAAAAYWRSQCDSAFAKPRLSSPQLSSTRDPIAQLQRVNLPMSSSVISRTPATASTTHTALATYLHAIADLQWRRAGASADAAAALEAVHRMGNLYAWGDRIVGAARGELGVADETSLAAVAVTARDLASWLLSEEAKREIEVLWDEWCCGVERGGERPSRGGSGSAGGGIGAGAGADHRSGNRGRDGSGVETEGESDLEEGGSGHVVE